MEHFPDFFQHFWDFVQNFRTLTNFFQMFLVFLNFSILKNFEKDTETESFSQFFLNRGGWVGKFSILSFLIKFHSTLYFLITLNNSLWQQKWKLIKKILSKTLTNFFQIFLVFLNSSILKNFEKDTETESFSQFFLNRGGWVGKFSILSFLIKFHSTLYFVITLNNSLWQQQKRKVFHNSF